MHLVPKGTKNEPNPKQTSNPPVPQSPKEYVKKVMPNPELLDGFNFQVVNQSSNKEAGDLATAGLFLAHLFFSQRPRATRLKLFSFPRFLLK